jgi:hypothetical protein
MLRVSHLQCGFAFVLLLNKRRRAFFFLRNIPAERAAQSCYYVSSLEMLAVTKARYSPGSPITLK